MDFLLAMSDVLGDSRGIMQGIDPEIRTYNTVIIACNMSSQAQEALRVYKRMLAVGAQPTATTYTALISAYGKIGQLERALQIFQVSCSEALVSITMNNISFKYELTNVLEVPDMVRQKGVAETS